MTDNASSGNLNLDKFWAQCLLIGTDPHKALAKVFSDDVIAEVGHLPIARLAFDVILAAQGPKVNINANITYPHQPVSESERWLEGIVTGRQTGADEVLSSE